jgi:hypothetical protein
MTEVWLTLRKLLGGRGPSASPTSRELDRERAASMADEGGAAAAEVEAQPTVARPADEDKPGGA